MPVAFFQTSDNVVKAAIIAAGEGSRLRVEGILLPKPLVKIGGIPLIERLLSSFGQAGITEAVCIINEDSLSVKDFVGAGLRGVNVSFHVKSTPSSMHSLFELASFLDNSPFLLSTVDSVFDPHELHEFLRYFDSRPDLDALLAVTDYIDDESPLYVNADASGVVRSFSRNDERLLVTGGLYLFSPRIFRECGKALNSGMSRLRNFLALLLAEKYSIETFRFGTIIDVDHPADIRAAEVFISAR